MTRETFTQNMKMLFAAHHYVYHSKDLKEIANVVNVKSKKLESWTQTDEWLDCLAYWGTVPKLGDFGRARYVWSQIVAFDEHVFPSEFPDTLYSTGRTVSEPLAESLKNNALEMRQYRPDILIAKPFIVEGLCDEQIRDRIAEERTFGYTPVEYEGQRLQGYYWWLYPNFDAGIFSKVFAKANLFGDIVVGADENTHLVCIVDGRLTLSPSISDDVVSVSDTRLLVCL